MPPSHNSSATEGMPSDEEMGRYLREAREARGLSLRALAERLSISPSALSQIETGKSAPSVKTLWAIVRTLDVSVDDLFVGGERADAQEDLVVQREATRPRLELESGVIWERLTPAEDPDIDFVLATYPPGSASGPADALFTHPGHELGIVMAGTLRLALEGARYDLVPGDSCSFDSRRAHRLSNPGDQVTRAIWFQVNGGGDGSLGHLPLLARVNAG